jgi:hypothetical protein
VGVTAKTESGTTGLAVRSAAILTPTLDFLAVGGLSIICFLPLLLSGRSDLVLVGAGAQAWLGTAINMPHFMASYRLVYRDRASIMKHKWASIYVPLILLVSVAVALWEAQRSPFLVIILATVSSVYLAWHYTGQAWGMMASHAYLSGMTWEPAERALVRWSLRILIVWHVTWFFYRASQLRNPEIVRPLYDAAVFASLIAFALGIIAFAKVKKRAGRLPPMKALVAWFAIFVWYAMMWRDPKAIFWIQIAHALQYLAFPIRVELNTAAGQKQNQSAAGPLKDNRAVHMAIYAVLLLGISVVVAQVVPYSAMAVVGRLYGEDPANAAPILILLFINIHHYFTDGVIWKLRNPDVRKELFAHVPQPAKKKK